MGEFIGNSARVLPENACGVVVVTHSRSLADGLVRGLGSAPSMLTMEPDVRSVEQWVMSREQRSIEELLALKDVSHERFRAVERLLKG